MIVRGEADALRFMEAEGVCGVWPPGAHVMQDREFCSEHCRLHGQHVAATADEMGKPFARGTHPVELYEHGQRTREAA